MGVLGKVVDADWNVEGIFEGVRASGKVHHGAAKEENVYVFFGVVVELLVEGGVDDVLDGVEEWEAALVGVDGPAADLENEESDGAGTQEQEQLCAALAPDAPGVEPGSEGEEFAGVDGDG